MTSAVKRPDVITRYIARALERAQYRLLEDGSFAATVRGLRGVIATGATLEACHSDLTEVIEEWVLVRVARVDAGVGPGQRRDLIAGLRALGFKGPFSGAARIHGPRRSGLDDSKPAPWRHRSGTAGADSSTRWRRPQGVGSGVSTGAPGRSTLLRAPATDEVAIVFH